MKLIAYRKKQGLTQQQAADELGLSSKGYFSSLESGQAPMPLKLALQIERWSHGQVLATELLAGEDADLLAAALKRRSIPPTPTGAAA